MAGWNRCCRLGYLLFCWYSCGVAMVLFKGLVEGRFGLVTSHIAYGVYYYIVQLNDGSAARSGWLYITY